MSKIIMFFVVCLAITKAQTPIILLTVNVVGGYIEYHFTGNSVFSGTPQNYLNNSVNILRQQISTINVGLYNQCTIYFNSAPNIYCSIPVVNTTQLQAKIACSSSYNFITNGNASPIQYCNCNQMGSWSSLNFGLWICNSRLVLLNSIYDFQTCP